jgi:hypothetical protein
MGVPLVVVVVASACLMRFAGWVDFPPASGNVISVSVVLSLCH